MFAWENGVVPSGRIRRETGSWGFVVVIKERGYKDEERIEINECGTFPPEEGVVMSEQMGSTGMSCGCTINMGNFESARVDCWCTLPCTEENADTQYEKCYDFVTEKVNKYAQSKALEKK